VTAEARLPLASRRVLIVDDQPSIRGVLEVALADAGALVRTAADGPSALRHVESGPPELILLDLMMPGMDGWQVIEALNASPQSTGIPVVLETSATDFESFERARKLGVAAFISKPFRLGEVIETCRRILEGARPLQGTPEKDGDVQPVQVRDASGRLLATGRLLDSADRGAQVDLDTPLSAGQRVTVSFDGPDGSSVRLAEVRWVRRVGSRYQHGLLLRVG
jgi:CheY-like chemotaxis protein